jgi:hypothetical protein
MRLRAQRERQRKADAHGVARRHALRVSNGGAKRRVDLDAGGQHEQLGLERRQAEHALHTQGGRLEIALRLRRRAHLAA